MDALSGRLSIVLPVYNEAPVIESVLTELVQEVVGAKGDAEIVVVDDCSTDGSAAILDRVAERHRAVRVVHAAANRGHGPSLRRAIEAASGEWIFHLDSDRQFVASDFWKLWERHGEADLVLGVRGERSDPRHRLVLSLLVRLAVTALTGRRVRDPNVPFKLFRRALWEDLRPLIGEDALAPSIMISVGAVLRDWRVAQVPVTHLAREHGVSSLRLWRLARFSLRGLGQLVRFRLAVALRPRAAPAGRRPDA